MHIAHRQCGAAALGVTLLLLFVATLVVGFSNRNLVFEHKSSANQIRSTRAFEAAEAGLEWAQAMLGSDAAIGGNCEPSTASSATAFRERFLAYDAASRRFNPRSWNDAGALVALQAACVLGESGWTCSCPSDGRPALATPGDAGPHPAFSVRFVAAPRAGMVQLLATGCDDIAPACASGLPSAAIGGATARVQTVLALLPALAGLPTAALTARGGIAVDGALTLSNTEASSSGVTAMAAGGIAMPAAMLTTLPGTATAASIRAHDAQLGAMDGERLFSRVLGLDRARWQLLSGVHALRCEADCGADLAQLLSHESVQPLLWIRSDLRLQGPVTIGSPERPVLLVVDGQMRLSGGVNIHGAVVSLASTWDTHGTADAQVHGALVALGSVTGNGTPTIVYDAQVLARLQGEYGTFARVPGSWRDF